MNRRLVNSSYEERDTKEFIGMTTLLKKSTKTSLYQREGFPSLVKRGEGRFSERNCPLTYDRLSNRVLKDIHMHAKI